MTPTRRPSAPPRHAPRRGASGRPGRPGDRPYHHGGPRRELLDSAAAIAAAEGPSAITLRDLARRAGVSHAAPAHHFGDKRGLLTARAALDAGAARHAAEHGGDPEAVATAAWSVAHGLATLLNAGLLDPGPDLARFVRDAGRALAEGA